MTSVLQFGLAVLEPLVGGGARRPSHLATLPAGPYYAEAFSPSTPATATGRPPTTGTAHRLALASRRVVPTGAQWVFVAFQSADDLLACAVAIQGALRDHRRAHGFAPQVRIGVHAAAATR